MRGDTGALFAGLVFLMGGCAGGGTTVGDSASGPAPLYLPDTAWVPPVGECKVTSRVVSGTRTRDRYGTGWDVDIEVEVEGKGPAFGLLGHMSSTLRLEGSWRLDDRDHWTNFNSDGWPERYSVEAKYKDWLDGYGKVTVIVEISDPGHSAYGSEIYEVSHTIEWE